MKDDLNHLFKRLRPLLYVFCYRISGDSDASDDFVQDILVDAFLEIRENNTPASRMILLRIAFEKMQSALASHKPWNFKDDHLVQPLLTHESFWKSIADETQSPVVSQRESFSIGFLTLLQHMPYFDRVVYLLSDVLAYSPAEILPIVGGQAESITSALKRAQHFMSQHYFVGNPKQVQWRADHSLGPSVETFVDILNCGEKERFKDSIAPNFNCILFPAPLFQQEIFYNDFLSQGISCATLNVEVNGQRVLAFEKAGVTQAIAILINSAKGVTTLLGWDIDALLPVIRKHTLGYLK